MNQTVVIEGEIKLNSVLDGDLGVLFGYGLEFESGTFSPETSSNNVTIQFERSHNKPPMFAAICDTEETYPDPAGETVTKIALNYLNKEAFGVNIPNRHGAPLAITLYYRWGEFDSWVSSMTENSMSETMTKFTTGGAFLPSRTYKWIAVWR